MSLLRQLRRYPRVRLNTQVAIGNAENLGLAYSVDLSEGGMGLTWPLEPPRPDEYLTAIFYLPGDELPLRLMAKVLHPEARDGHGAFGLAFVDVDAETHKRLRRFVRTRRFLYGDLRAPTTNPVVCQRMTERLGRVRGR